jgi:hypothetical protein
MSQKRVKKQYESYPGLVYPPLTREHISIEAEEIYFVRHWERVPISEVKNQVCVVRMILRMLRWVYVCLKVL